MPLIIYLFSEWPLIATEEELSVIMMIGYDMNWNLQQLTEEQFERLKS